MNLEDCKRRLDEERRWLARAGEVVEVVPPVTRLRAGDGARHAVIFSSLTAGDADGVIAREVEHHRGLGVGFEWKVYGHDTPADLLERLRGHGLVVGPCEAVLVCDLAEAPGWVAEMDGSGVVVIATLEQVEVYRQVTAAVHGEADEGTANELADALRRGSSEHRGYIVYSAGTPVSVGRLYTHPESKFGGLYGGATRKEFRGQGYYRALVAARARDAMRSGARYLVVDALPASRVILERMGFRWLTETWPCEWSCRALC